MKSKTEVEFRLRSLRVKYANRYVAKTQARCHQNCTYNFEQAPLNSRPKTKTIDSSMVPKKQMTLMVIQPESSIRLCMYGSNNPATWPGDICDSDDISSSCPMFKPSVSLKEARNEFMQLLADDEYVFNVYKDLAVFQWVLSDRLSKMPLSWWESIILWIQMLIFRSEKPTPRLPDPPLTNLWDDDDSPPVT